MLTSIEIFSRQQNIQLLITALNIFLYCGALYAHLADDAPAFNRFSDTLRRILLPRSSILITACLTGKINEESDARSYHLETHKNCDYDNWANNLSKNLIGHRIFCTPDGQAANEIILDTSLTGGEEMCGKEKKGENIIVLMIFVIDLVMRI